MSVDYTWLKNTLWCVAVSTGCQMPCADPACDAGVEAPVPTGLEDEAGSEIGPVDPTEEGEAYIRYQWRVDWWPNEVRVEVFCDGALFYTRDEFDSAQPDHEVRIEAAPGSLCQMQLHDGLGEALPAGSYTLCDVPTGAWDSQLGAGPWTVGEATVEACLPGCMDSVAENYNPAATSDDESCVYVEGCTDPLAENYDETATVDDESCVYEGFATVDVRIKTDLYPSHTTVELMCGDYSVFRRDDYDVAETWVEDSLLIDAGYICDVEVSDALGDSGPDGEVWLCGERVLEWERASGLGGTPWTIAVGTFVVESCSGCTSEDAINYDPTALVDDGSCQW